MRILGIDPGSAIMGFGVVDWEAGALTHVVHGTLRPPRNLNVAGRLNFLCEGVKAVISEHQPDAAAVEQVFVSVSPRSALVLGQARGAALAAVGASGIALAEYSASQIKQSTTGNGRAAKAQVQSMIRRLLALDKVPVADAADALAAACCHAYVSRLGCVLAEPVRRNRTAGSRTANPRSANATLNPSRKVSLLETQPRTRRR
jgi:crossover junction endodeoxyribonuclease RuvC